MLAAETTVSLLSKSMFLSPKQLIGLPACHQTLCGVTTPSTKLQASSDPSSPLCSWKPVTSAAAAPWPSVLQSRRRCSLDIPRSKRRPRTWACLAPSRQPATYTTAPYMHTLQRFSPQRTGQQGMPFVSCSTELAASRGYWWGAMPMWRPLHRCLSAGLCLGC